MINVIKAKKMLIFLTFHSLWLSSYETLEFWCRGHVYMKTFSVISSNCLSQLFKILRLKDTQEQLFSLRQN